MANLLTSSAMISTQIQALFLEAFERSPNFKKTLRDDIKAVKDRDPAVKSYTDVILYFKGTLTTVEELCCSVDSYVVIACLFVCRCIIESCEQGVIFFMY